MEVGEGIESAVLVAVAYWRRKAVMLTIGWVMEVGARIGEAEFCVGLYIQLGNLKNYVHDWNERRNDQPRKIETGYARRSIWFSICNSLLLLHSRTSKEERAHIW